LVLEGLEVRSLDSLLSWVSSQKFNALRLLFNMQDWRDNPVVPPEHFSAELNPELVGARYRDMLVIVTRAAARHGILVMPACHRLKRSYRKILFDDDDDDVDQLDWPGTWDGWWFDIAAGFSQTTVGQLWNEVARTLCTEWNVFAADVRARAPALTLHKPLQFASPA
jgi:hypothetical protein